MKNPLIDTFNSNLRQKLPPYLSTEVSDISVLYALNELIKTPVADNHTEDGIHFDTAITRTQINLMLNLRCNDELPKKFPFDATCCMRYPAPNWLQSVIIILSFVWAPLGLHYYASSKWIIRQLINLHTAILMSNISYRGATFLFPFLSSTACSTPDGNLRLLVRIYVHSR